MKDITRPKYSGREWAIISDIVTSITPEVLAPLRMLTSSIDPKLGAAATTKNESAVPNPVTSSSGQPQRPETRPARGMLKRNEATPKTRYTLKASVEGRPNSCST